MESYPTDRFTDRGDTFIYQGGGWTTPGGMCVSTTRGAELTMKFYERHGRVPLSHEPPPPKRPTRKSELAKAKVLRAAIAKALSSRPPQAE